MVKKEIDDEDENEEDFEEVKTKGDPIVEISW